jgi:hypothetical protein
VITELEDFLHLGKSTGDYVVVRDRDVRLRFSDAEEVVAFLEWMRPFVMGDDGQVEQVPPWEVGRPATNPPQE